MHVFAYLDPATGSLFAQVVIGSVLAGSVILRTTLRSAISRMKLVFVRATTGDKEA